MPSRQSPSERRKRSASPTGDDRRVRRRRNEERNDDDTRSRSKRSSERDSRSSKYQRANYEQKDRRRRRSENEDDDGEEKPTRVSRFVEERKPEQYRRSEIGSDSRNYDSALPDNRRQSYRNDRSNMPPPRWGESAGRRGYDDGSHFGGASAGYSRRSSTFGRWGGGRGGRGGRGRTIVYRPGEEEQRPTMNLFDPTKVPKGRSYFEHEDRTADAFRRGRGRVRGRFSRGRDMPSSWQRPSADTGGGADDVWQHDMFEEAETVDTEKESSDVTMEEAEKSH